MAAPARPSGLPTTLLFVVVGLAVVVGIVASLVVASAPALPKAQPTEVTITLPPTVWGVLFISPLLVGLAGILFRRATEGGRRVGVRTALTVLAIFAVAIVLILIMNRASPGPALVTLGPGTGPGTNGTGNNSSSTHGGHGNNTTYNGSGTVPAAKVLVLNAWDLLLVLVAVSALVAGLTIPGVLSRLVDRGPRDRPPPPVDRAKVEAALADAAAAIGRGEDPRETVVRLYVRLLGEVVPRFGDVTCLTPDEIRRTALAGLSVGPRAAEAMTRMFEEARYSTHPIGPAEAGRFGDVIREVQADLARSVAS